MDRVSRPLIGLLVATVAFFALWVTMLKPSSSTSGANAGNIAKNPSLGQLRGAVAAAHAAVAASATTPVSPVSPSPAAPTPARTAPTVQATPVHHATRTRSHVAHRSHLARVVARLTPAARLALVRRALAAHRVLALLFFNPSAADDRAVDRELATVPTHRGAVVKLAVPLAEVASYATLTTQSPVSTSPTLLIVDRTRSASELVGFADRFEIAQRVADALPAGRR